MKNTKIKLLFLILTSMNLYSIDLENAITQLENQSYTAEKNKLKMICIAFVFISDCKYNSKVIQFKPILQLFRIILNNILKNDE